MRYLALLAAIGSTVAGTASGQDSWLCIEEQSTGFRLDQTSNNWVIAKFKTDARFLVRPVKPDELGYNPDLPEDVIAYSVMEFGYTSPVYDCNTGLYLQFKDEFTKWDEMICSGLTGQFQLNVETLRFMVTYFAGYTRLRTDGGEDTGNTPHIAIGTCSKL